MKVHVVLRKEAASDAGEKDRILEKICERTSMSRVNLKRFERYGVITGEIEPSELDELRTLDGVASVEADQEKHVS